MGVAQPESDSEALRMVAAELEMGQSLDMAIGAAAPMARSPQRWLSAAARARDGEAATAVLATLIPDAIRLDADVGELASIPSRLAILADAQLRVHQLVRRIEVSARYPMLVLFVALVSTVAFGGYGGALRTDLGANEVGAGFFADGVFGGVASLVWLLLKAPFDSPLSAMVCSTLLLALGSGAVARLTGRFDRWWHTFCRILPGGRVVDIGHEVEWLERLDALVAMADREDLDWRRTLPGLTSEALRRDLDSGQKLSDDVAMIRAALEAGEVPHHGIKTARTRRDAMVPRLLRTLQHWTGYLLLSGAAVFVARLSLRMLHDVYGAGSSGLPWPGHGALEYLVAAALGATVVYRAVRRPPVRVPLLDLVGGAMADGVSLYTAAKAARSTRTGSQRRARRQLDQLLRMIDSGVDERVAATRVATRPRDHSATLDVRVAWLLRPGTEGPSHAAWSDWLVARATYPVDAGRLLYPLVLAIMIGWLAAATPSFASASHGVADSVADSLQSTQWSASEHGVSSIALFTAALTLFAFVFVQIRARIEPLEVLVCRALAGSDLRGRDIDRRLELLGAGLRSFRRRWAVARLRGIVRDGASIPDAMASFRWHELADAMRLSDQLRVASCADLVEARLERRRRRHEALVAAVLTIALVSLGVCVALVAIGTFAPSQLALLYRSGEMSW